jgi:drug/metabolite transporter (DMT)-like permease
VRRSFAPALFVVLWSTGFISAKFGLPYAGPLTYLLLRFVLVAMLMGGVALASGATWPARPVAYAHVALTGVLVHGLYLGGVFVAISRGMPAGTAAMLVGVQPILTVFLARVWLGEHTTSRQLVGLVVGLVGVYFVVEHKIRLTGLDALALTAIVIALAAISVGTLYQKRHGTAIDMRAAAVIQFGACTLLFAVLAPFLETSGVDWTWQFAFALGWSVLVLSVGAISLLFWLLRHGAAGDVARLFYLVPASTMLIAYFMFGETVTWLALGGMALIAVGVLLARPAASRPDDAGARDPVVQELAVGVDDRPRQGQGREQEAPAADERVSGEGQRGPDPRGRVADRRAPEVERTAIRRDES